jgi:hypothetical protein
MTAPDRSEPVFGCDACWPADAAAADRVSAGLPRQPPLISESHYSVTIAVCPRCGQRFVLVFTETIDWAGGNDPQSWSVLPVTEAEAADLTRAGSAVTEDQLEALGPGRRSLYSYWPSDAERKARWSTGLRVGMHD